MNIAPALTATLHTTDLHIAKFSGKKVSVIEPLDVSPGSLYDADGVTSLYLVQVFHTGEELEVYGDELTFDAVDYRGFSITTDGKGADEAFTITDGGGDEFMTGIESLADALAAIDALLKGGEIYHDLRRRD